MTCPISCRITPSKMPSSSMSAMSSMSNLIAPAALMVGHEVQYTVLPAEPRVPPTPSISSSVALISIRPAG